MSESSRTWLRLTVVAALSGVVMSGCVALLIAVLPARTPPSQPVAQVSTPAAVRPPTGTDTIARTNNPATAAIPPLTDSALSIPRKDAADIEPHTPLPVSTGSPTTTPPTTGTTTSEPTDTPPRWKVGDTFTQEVVVTRRSAYRILGADLGQDVQYAFTSRFTVDKAERDGSLVVKQKLVEARFREGDPAMQALLNDSLKKAQGADFEIALDGKGRVTRFRGAKETVQVFAGNNPLAGQTFLLWSFMDDDAWKELAQITFFQPDEPLRTGAKWSRKLTHSWGPLGSWGGQTGYVAAGKQAGLERINYAHEMTYQPPRGGGNLPFKVMKADFKPLAAGGAMLFDAGKGRVTEAEGTFRVRGTVVVAVGDTEAAVDMDETQVFRLRITAATPPK